MEFGDEEGQIPIDEIARKAEEYRPSERVTYKIIQEYIENKYNFKVHTAYWIVNTYLDSFFKVM